jgi:hypothetical protein
VFDLLLRRLRMRAPSLSADEATALHRAVLQELSTPHPSARVLREWFRTERSTTKPAILVTFRAPVGFKAPPGVMFDGKALPWKLGLNQTNKESIAAALGTRVITRWVGWITLYVDPHVEMGKTGKLVRGLRIKNVAPKLPPTFDWLKNVAARIDKARKQRGASAVAIASPVTEISDHGSVDEETQAIDEMEAARIAAMERDQ